MAALWRLYHNHDLQLTTAANEAWQTKKAEMRKQREAEAESGRQ